MAYLRGEPPEACHVAEPDPSLAQHRAPQVAPDHGGQGPRRRRCPDQRADHDQHQRPRRQGDPGPGHRRRRCRRRHRAHQRPGPGDHARAARDLPREPGADRRRHPFPLQARHRGCRGGRRLSAHQPRQHRGRKPRARGHQGGQGPRLFDPHRRECRQPGKAPAGEIWRALSRRDGRKRAGPYQDPAGQRFPRIQDQREGQRRVPVGRGLSAAVRGDGRADPSGHHRGGRFRRRHRQVGDGPGQPSVDGDRRHDPRQPVGRSGRGGQGRLRDPEIAWPAARAACRSSAVPVLRTAGLRRDPHGRGAGKAAGAHQDADEPVDHRLRGERTGRGADDRSGLHRRRGRVGHGLSWPASRATSCRTTRWSITSSGWSRNGPRSWTPRRALRKPPPSRVASREGRGRWRPPDPPQARPVSRRYGSCGGSSGLRRLGGNSRSRDPWVCARWPRGSSGAGPRRRRWRAGARAGRRCPPGPGT